MRSPGRLLAIAAVVTIVVGEARPAAIVSGLVGALGGLLTELAGLQIGLLAGALLLGVGVQHVVIGFGARLAEWGSAARPVVLRAVPLFLSVAVGPGRAPVRLRMWGAALCSTLAGLGGGGGGRVGPRPAHPALVRWGPSPRESHPAAP